MAGPRGQTFVIRLVRAHHGPETALALVEDIRTGREVELAGHPATELVAWLGGLFENGSPPGPGEPLGASTRRPVAPAARTRRRRI